jgi:hypothetical protein
MAANAAQAPPLLVAQTLHQTYHFLLLGVRPEARAVAPDAVAVGYTADALPAGPLLSEAAFGPHPD